MEATIKYAVDRSVPLELPDEALVAQCDLPRGVPVEDLAAALTAALEEPLDYPALVQCTTPGDRVVLALEQAVPESAAIVAAVVACLVRGGVALDGISILQTKADEDVRDGDPPRDWPEAWKQRITMLRHDPADRNQLAYLSTTHSGEIVFFNRALTDADVVLPIGCLRSDAAAGYFGPGGVVYPAFSNQPTQSQFASLGWLRARGKRKKRIRANVDEAAWLLGVSLTIQVVPAGGGRIMHVLAGEPAAVRRRGRELYRSAWKCVVPRRASLVVVAIDGDAGQQTWQNLGRALAAAGRLVEDGGAIAVCCGLACDPGPAVRCLAEAESSEDALRQIRKAKPADALPAVQLREATRRGGVYLLSELDESLVERLEMVPVGGADELARLVRRQPSCILLSNAHHASVRVEQE
jgi:nickel-dependent lactate racemase